MVCGSGAGTWPAALRLEGAPAASARPSRCAITGQVLTPRPRTSGDTGKITNDGCSAKPDEQFRRQAVVGEPKTPIPGSLGTVGPTCTITAAQGHDHEGFIALPHYKAFTTPQSFMKSPC